MVVRWPDTPFEESMLNHGVIIHCPDRDLVDDLFAVLRKNDVRWSGEDDMTQTFWKKNGNKMCYRVSKGRRMWYGSTHTYSDDLEFGEYIKCTFYGADTDESDISEEKFLALFDSGGE